MASIFKENLRFELDYQGITAIQLADITGIPYRTIINYLSARETTPTIEAALKIARALNTTVEALVIGQEKKKELPTNMQKNIRLFTKLSEPDQTVVLRIMEGLLIK
ncbi:MAG: helix-turn-helix transcriptional regulator [Treponema sp.]|nr:helix-turn-helix transcriptional regulator [Treponema sp.]